MYVLILALHVIASLFLIFIILIQSSKGEGLSDVFGGGSSQTTIFGTRTGTFLTKATTASAIVFMITSLSLTLLSRQRAGSAVQRELFKQQMNQKVEDILKGKEDTGKKGVEPQTAIPQKQEPVKAAQPAAAPGAQVK